MLAILLVAAAHQFDFAAHRLDVAAPAQALAIRAALFELAAATRALPAGMTGDSAAKALYRHVADRDALLDVTRFPSEVDVTFRGLGRAACIETESMARRLEGSVVVQLEGYATASDCGGSNAMTWRIMP
ncbi:MAG TPA: hypothetical protein VEI03_23140 [Stellaceae bacterium]|nr:hypothetical protein [Stellaceae bacterium]